MRIKCELRITDEYGSDLSVVKIRPPFLIADTQPVLIRSY